MLMLVCATLVLPLFLEGQHTGQSGSQAASTRCPDMSCHLHEFPDENCIVRTYFEYNGVVCDGCVEDICNKSRGLRAEISQNNGMFSSSPNFHTHSREWNRFNGVSRLRNMRREGNHMVLLDPANFIMRNMLRLRRQRLREMQIVCPKLECDQHHVPVGRCAVPSFFIHRGRRCIGCLEDICLRTDTAVPDSRPSETSAGGTHTDVHRDSRGHTHGESRTHGIAQALTDSHGHIQGESRTHGIAKALTDSHGDVRGAETQIHNEATHGLQAISNRQNHIAELDPRHRQESIRRFGVNRFNQIDRIRGGLLSGGRQNAFGDRRQFPTNSPSANSKCPDMSCHLHEFPNHENCIIRTHFVYNGQVCDGCVEDICSGTGVLPTPSAIRGHVLCPRLNCRKHHRPENHCAVVSYFVYHGRRCTGCLEDVCVRTDTIVPGHTGVHVGNTHNEEHANGEHQSKPSVGSKETNIPVQVQALIDQKPTTIPDKQVETTKSKVTSIVQRPSRFHGTGKGLQRFTGQARSYLQGLFHPAFSG